MGHARLHLPDRRRGHGQRRSGTRIRERDRNGSSAVLCGENHPPYNRPPLSKKLRTGRPLAGIWCYTEETGAVLLLDTRAAGGDIAARTLVDADGQTCRVEKLLLVAGGDGVVIGGGFIGSDIAAALAGTGCRVTLVFPDAAIDARICPPGLAHFLNGYYRRQGVTVLSGQRCAAIERRGERFEVRTTAGESPRADAVVAGIEPATELVKSLGLNIDNGVVVDDR